MHVPPDLGLLVLAPVVAWLALGALTTVGARHRGNSWLPALVIGLLLFPVAWVAWYLKDVPSEQRRWNDR